MFCKQIKKKLNKNEINFTKSVYDKWKDYGVDYNETLPSINSACNNKLFRIDIRMNFREGKYPAQITKFVTKKDEQSKIYYDVYYIANKELNDFNKKNIKNKDFLTKISNELIEYKIDTIY